MYANVGGLNFLRFFSQIGRYLSKDQEIYEFPGSGILPPDKLSRSKSFHALRLHFPKLIEARSTDVIRELKAFHATTIQTQHVQWSGYIKPDLKDVQAVEDPGDLHRHPLL